ncbi:MAG: serine hydrolase domain-containing protein [Bacteroidota bacterium]
MSHYLKYAVLFNILFQTATSQNLTDLNSSIDSIISNHNMASLMVGVLKEDEVIFQKSYGYADIENKILADKNTSYLLASLSKPITAAAILNLHQDGLLNLDDPITKYVSLKKVNGSFKDPTIRQVMNHTSGLGTYFDIYYKDENIAPVNFEEAWAQFGILFHEPGKVNEYSNLGYGLLDYIISKVTAKSFLEYLNTNIFEKMQMKDAFVIDGVHNLNKNIAMNYDHELKVLPQLWTNTPGAGNIAISLNDLLNFAKSQLEIHSINDHDNNKIGEFINYREPNALFHYYNDSYYGLGWYIRVNDNGQKVIWHEGGMMGVSTSLKLYPKEDIAICILMNTHNVSVCREIADLVARNVIKNYQPDGLNEVASYKPISESTSIKGLWTGTLKLEEKQIPMNLEINDNLIKIRYISDEFESFLTDYQPLPMDLNLLFGMMNKQYFIGTAIGELPLANKRKDSSHLLSLKLYHQGNTLKGTIVNMAASKREYYARPYYISLKKVEL